MPVVLIRLSAYVRSENSLLTTFSINLNKNKSAASHLADYALNARKIGELWWRL
jgi:hypothetical protein